MTSPIQVEDNSAHLTVVVNKILSILYDECKPLEALDIISNVTAAILAASQPSSKRPLQCSSFYQRGDLHHPK